MTNTRSHVLSLADEYYEYGLVLDQKLRLDPQTPNTLTPAGGGTRFGDYDPTFSNVEQSSWIDGMGQEFRDIRRSGFLDSRNAWTLSQDYIMPSMMWRWADGIIESYEHLSHSRNMDWQPSWGTTRYISIDFTVGAGAYDAGKVYVWIRRKGSPAAATLAIYTDTGGDPNAVVASATDTIDTDDITDFTSEWYGIDVSAAGNLSATTKYHVVFDGGSGATESSHWEIGVNEAGSSSKTKSTAGSWTAASYSMYHRVIPARINRIWKFFNLEKAFYAIDVRDDGGNSTLLINGDRGIATSGAATTITDSTKSWTTDEWIGASVRITKGTGKGQYRSITDSTGTALTVATWDINPDATSEYVIYDCDQWNTIATSQLTAVKDVAVLNNIVYFAQGSGDALVRLYWNSAGPSHDDADVGGSAKADGLYVDDDSVDGPIMWRWENDDVDVSRSTADVWGTDTAFGSAIDIGADDYEIVDIAKYQNAIYVMKENHPYKIVNDRAEPFLRNLDFIPSEYQGVGAIEHDVFFYIPWGGWTLEEFFGSSLNDVGYTEFPSDRVGNYSFLSSHPAGLIAGIDAGSGISSIMIRHKGRNTWHPIFEGYEAGARIRSGIWQDNPGSRPRLWFSINGDIMCMKFPRRFVPIKDTSIEYHHEAVVEMSKIDMNAASLFKYFHDLTLRSRNLNEERHIVMEYKLDEDIENTSKEWINRELKFTSSTKDVVPIREGEVNKIQFRLRLQTNLRTTPPVVEATNLEGTSRTPFKFQYTIIAKTKPTQIDRLGNPDHEPDDLISFLKQAASKAKVLTLKSDYPFADNIPVLVEPFALQPDLPNAEGDWGGRFTFVVRDA